MSIQKQGVSDILLKEKQEQLRLLANALDPFINTLTIQTDPILTEDDLNRISAYQDEAAYAREFVANADISTCTAVLQGMHEGHRTRRDINRINKTHKELVLDSLTVANKKRKILEQVL